MAIFYGTLLGKSGSVASRHGSRKSGLNAVMSSWDGVLGVGLSHNLGTGLAEVNLYAWEGDGFPIHVLYSGPIIDLARGLYVTQRLRER